MGNKLIEPNTTYKIKLTGSSINNAEMHFKFGGNIDSNGNIPNVRMKDASGNYLPNVNNTVFTNGVMEFYATTDSQIVDIAEFHIFRIFLDWGYSNPMVTISSIEITKV